MTLNAQVDRAEDVYLELDDKRARTEIGVCQLFPSVYVLMRNNKKKKLKFHKLLLIKAFTNG